MKFFGITLKNRSDRSEVEEDKNFQDLLNACRSGDLERVERLLNLTS
jgi:hypothetical protein